MELLYVLCQLAAPEICEEHRTPYASGSPMACVTMAQAELARLGRPGWAVASWRCRPPQETAAAEVPVTASDREAPEGR
jgi:hypothetical protein